MRRPILFRALLLLILVGVFLAGWAFWWEPASLRLVEHRLSLPGWPSETPPLRLALLADLHTGSPHHGLETLEEVVELTNAATPDLILLAGDFVIHGVVGGQFVSPEEIAGVLGGLKAPRGVFAVLGNHDWWLNPDRVRAAFEAVGIPILEDEARRLEGAENRLWVVGVSDYWEGPYDIPRALAGVTDDAPVILFTHNPDLFPEVPPRVTLTLAGHTHGGQVNLPVLGRLVVPSNYGTRFAIGWVQEEGRHLFVTPGLGTSILPVRFRVPPEISLLEIRGR